MTIARIYRINIKVKHQKFTKNSPTLNSYCIYCYTNAKYYLATCRYKAVDLPLYSAFSNKSINRIDFTAYINSKITSYHQISLSHRSNAKIDLTFSFESQIKGKCVLDNDTQLGKKIRTVEMVKGK